MIKIINIDSEQFENIKCGKQTAIVVENNDFQLGEKLCLMEDVEVDELQTQDSLIVSITHLLFDENNYCITEDCVLISFQLFSMNHRQLIPLKETFGKQVVQDDLF